MPMNRRIVEQEEIIVSSGFSADSIPPRASPDAIANIPQARVLPLYRIHALLLSTLIRRLYVEQIAMRTYLSYHLCCSMVAKYMYLSHLLI
jgi:hypothetical protein